MLREILCTNCQGAGLELQPDGSAVCRFCGTANKIAGSICPQCERVNPPGMEHCANCNAALVRTCPDCGARNWSGADRCVNCGRALDLVEFLSAKWRTDIHSELQAGAKGIQAVEGAAADRRMAQMMAMEEQRQRELRAAAERQAARERQTMAFVYIAVIALVAFVAIAVLVAMFAK